MTDNEFPKVIPKPWGREVWLELNDKYCFKRLELNAGHRTSLQYHDRKLETMCFLEGEGEIFLDYRNGATETIEIRPGVSVTVRPGTIHRVTAITNLIYHEASTPEVDDVIRLGDDYQRK